ncbi:hypothetical protein AMS58_09795 [Pseudoalteromonas porphyrae]|uniref:Agglutinin biogenesis protein MshK n=2 Tax=Pseudoalteromonas TaxID=53246 RepID=A0A0N1ESH3_9GAMM|nr:MULTISPECIES: hypothetical protein [Pseudoalteromonas]KPH62192.1 hypothetical protein ADS77_12905 [Pseudoalteromonas porphyrae]KPH94801.1 hypothetical protein AMS58_09795 [Pseudoalteromonas porphyrae]
MKNFFHCSLWLISICASVAAVAQTLKDPTRPQTITTKGSGNVLTGNLILQSIIKKQQGYKAIISGQLYAIGDQIDGYKVLAINSKRVVLANDNKQIKLDLYDYDIKN